MFWILAFVSLAESHQVEQRFICQPTEAVDDWLVERLQKLLLSRRKWLESSVDSEEKIHVSAIEVLRTPPRARPVRAGWLAPHHQRIMITTFQLAIAASHLFPSVSFSLRKGCQTRCDRACSAICRTRKSFASRTRMQ